MQVSGTGYYAGIYTSYNPSTGQLAINPKNYAYVTGNLQTTTLLNGEVLSTITMPSGFGLSSQYGNLNVLNMTNIPVAGSAYAGALESYSSFTGKYTLTYPGTFPSYLAETKTLQNGVSETLSASRVFNTETGAISYSTSNYFTIPGIGQLNIGTAPLNQTYNYKGQTYAFAFNPSTSTYSITGQPAAGSTKTPDFFATLKNAATELKNTQTIQYNFSSTGGVMGYTVTTSSGRGFGADYVTLKPVAEGSVAQPTFVGKTLVLPSTEYSPYINNVDSNVTAQQTSTSLSAQQNAATQEVAKLPVFGSAIAQVSKVYNPGLLAYQGGELVAQGYTLQGLQKFGVGLAEGEAPVFLITSPAGAVVNAGISSGAQAVTNLVQGKPITTNLVSAASIGADFGGLYGATISADTASLSTAQEAGLNAVKIGAGFGIFTSFENLTVSLFGGYPSGQTASTSKIQPSQSQQGSAGKSQSSFSLLGNNIASPYINLGISSFAQGFTEGTEAAGAVGTLFGSLSGAATTSTTAKAIQGRE